MKKIILLLFLLNFVSCASQKVAEKKIEQEIQSEKVTTPSDVTEYVHDYIQKSSTITALQKKDLINLFDKSNSELKATTEEVDKAKVVLMKTMLEPKVNEREVYILNSKIKKLNKQKLNLDYRYFKEARRIIDPLKEIRDREFLYNSFLRMDRNYYYW